MNSRTIASQREEMQKLNETQKVYYERDGANLRNAGNVVTRLWAQSRGCVQRYRRELGIKDNIRALHMSWLGDLSASNVMELGCDSGNAVSLYMAAHANSYLGVDLNSVAIEELKGKLRDSGLTGDAVAIDFLDQEFPYGPFDVVYAHGVMHHFRYFEAFVETLASRLAPGGRVIAFDPLQTAMVPRLVRAAYRPFQSDSDWEWPLSKLTFKTLEKHFEIEELQGVLGWSKWGILALPLGVRFATAVGRPLHRRDLRHANRRGASLWRCMNVAMMLKKK